MVTVHIEAGICGLNTSVRAFRTQKECVGIAIKSDCNQVTALGGERYILNMNDVIRNPINKNPVYEKAGKCSLHSGCPVPCGVIKAAEAELGLALIKDVRIVFQNDNKVVDDAV